MTAATTPAQQRAARLALEPLQTTGPAQGALGGTFAQIKDIWAHRQLLDMLIRRELKARYKDSSLGFVWSLMRPLALLLIYYVAIGQFMGGARGIPEFAVFMYSGLTAWNLFTEIVMAGTGSIVGNAGLIKKVYLPREIFPLSSVGSALFNFGIQLAVLVFATVISGSFPLGIRWLYLPLSLAVIVLVGTFWAILLSAVNVYLRDVQYLVEIAVMLFFWLSPIVYSWTQVSATIGPGLLRDLYAYNPITLAVFGFQRTFWVAGTGTPAPDHVALALLAWCGGGLVLIWFAQRVFLRLQGNFAQEL